MISDEQLLLKEGAEYFGNRLIYRNQDVGVTAPGSTLVLFPEAEPIVANLRNITDVEPKAAKPKKVTGKPQSEAEQATDMKNSDELDELLGK